MAIWFEIWKQKIKMAYKGERNKIRFNKVSFVSSTHSLKQEC